MKKIYLALAAIAAIFLLSRLVKISSVPPSVYWDEASIGYNAYSVLKTGKDEWGEFLPLHFRAFGEFKLPVYIYSVALMEVFFGLSEIAVRLPAVMFSLGAVFLTFLLARRIFKNDLAAIISALSMALSPWLFIFSRTGYEATAGLAFFLLGLYLFLLEGKKTVFFLAGTLVWIASIYSYNAFRIVIPLTALLLIIYFFREIRLNVGKYIKVILVSLFILGVSAFPIARLYTKDVGAARFNTVSVRSPSEFISNYLSHYSFSFLFSRGDANLRSQMPGVGQLYFIELPFLLAGTIFILKSRKKLFFLPLALLLLAPIPAAITRESPHALRAITMLPFLAMISGAGVAFISSMLPKYKNIAVGTVVIAYLAFFETYIQGFFNLYPIQSSSDWQYGYKIVFTQHQEEFSNYDKVIVSEKYAQPYIFALFYLKYDPLRFQKEAVRTTPDRWGFSSVEKFDKYVFKKITSQDYVGKTLVFASDEDAIKGTASSGIKFLNGTEALKVYKQ
ncbi:hypothetical protein A2V56_02680 [Candidatus Woesebacteria bacterium RBG_19FT_COMBO_42_9]|nr:MAG: hypothetical protein A2V56_02680 [Candidatus Woesebacteria bacterium RBG_19FT_COMBO_42_9]